MTETSRAEFKYLIERQREEIRAINEVGKLLASSHDPEELYQLVSTYLRNTLPIALCGLLLPKNDLFKITRFANITDVDTETTIAQILEMAAQTLPDADNLKQIAPNIKDQLEHTGEWAHHTPIRNLQSHHITQITDTEKTLGILVLFSGKPEAFSKEDRHVIDIVADQLGAALRNALLMQALVQANKLKQDLLMVISHELRTPLTSITEGVNLVLDGTLGTINEEQDEFLKTVSANTHRLGKLVDRVLLSTQLVSGKLTYKKEPVVLKQVLQHLEEQFREMAQKNEITLNVTLPSESLSWQGDDARLLQALGQFIENALQATQAQGSVTLACNELPDKLEILITDTGIGIAEEDLKQLFSEFNMVGSIDDRKTGGLGLGLFIARSLLQDQGGAVSMSSEKGKSTTVTVHLPK